MDKQLRMMAAQIVVESKLSKAAKIQMLNFIKEDATDAQVKALLLDGKIVQLDEQAEEIVNKRFELSDLNESVALAVGIVALGISWTGVGWLAYRGIKSAFNEKAHRCGTFSVGIKRKSCYAEIEVQRLKKTIELVVKQKVACAKTKDPKKCLEKNKNSVMKLQAKLAKQQQKLQKYAQKNAGKASQGKTNAERGVVVAS